MSIRTRNVFSFQRWGTIVTYFLIAVLVAFLAQPRLTTFLNLIEARFDELNQWVIVVTPAGFVVVVIWLFRFAGFRFAHLRTTLRYPSFAIAVVLGLILLLVAYDKTKQTGSETLGLAGQAIFWFVCVIVLLDIVKQVVKPMGRTPAEPMQGLAKRSLKEIDRDTVLMWSRVEAPISEPSQDFFAYHGRAARILKQLTSEEKRTVAILGEFGSGKSSLLNLAVDASKDILSPRLCFVSVSCWGFDNPVAAQEAVLLSLLKELSIPRCLRLATDIHHYLFAESPDEDLRVMQAKIMSRLKDMLSPDAPSILANGLDEDHPATLFHLLILNEPRGRNPSEPRDWKSWSWLGPILIEGIKRFPGIIVPQATIATGLSHTHPSLSSDFLVNEGSFRDLFGDQSREAMSLLSQPFPINPQIKQRDFQMDLTLVNSRAGRWLTANGNR